MHTESKRVDRTKKYSILYVDDEESNLRIFRTSFKRYYKVHTVASGEEGLKVLQENPVDLILTDQKMPEMTGVDFLKQVIPHYPDPVRIIVTGFSDTESIIRAINECGIYQYITKPWKNEELKFIIDKALESYQIRMNNKQLVNQLKEANEDLEQKVIDRTQELAQKNEEVRKSRDILFKTAEAMRKTNNKLTNSINYAKRIQNAILPPIESIKAKIPNSFVLFKPRDIISGDFYWYGEVGNKTILGAFDCTGHGVPGAFMTLIGNDLLNFIIHAEHITDPAIILSKLHKKVVEHLKQDANQNQDGMDVAICVLDEDNNTLEFAGAKNTLVVIKDGEMTEYKGDKFPIGGTQGYLQRDFSKQTISLNGGAACYMFSDGYIDQFGGEDNKKFMRKRFKNLLQEITHDPMDKQKDVLENTIEDWMNGYTQIDDILVVGFKL